MIVSFLLNSLLLGVALAVDAFAVSVANGLKNQGMKKRKACLMAGTFGFFQMLMPFLGWIAIHELTQAFQVLTKVVPFVSFAILSFLGIRMIIESRQKKDEDAENAPDQDLTLRLLLVQGIATSIDALSAGLSFSDYEWYFALAEAAIIGVMTFGICMLGALFGKKASSLFRNGKAELLGGIILIAIGIELLVKGIIHLVS